jgi:N-acetyl-anhydromuramyl-L-alanine amidase AmpD
MKDMRRIDMIIIHCSATRCDRSFTVGDLEACHRAKGYNGIGYHYYITRDGRIHPCRSEEAVGAHARHYNAHSIGVCYEGGLDEKGCSADTRTPAQKAALHTVLTSLKIDYPNAVILGHRDLPWVRKSCPGFDARTEYRSL